MSETRFSASVRAAVERSAGRAVTPAWLTAAVLELHPEYGGGLGGEVTLDTERGARAPAAVWADLVQGGEEAGWGLDGRSLILGLARLDQQLATELQRSGLIRALAGEVAGPALPVPQSTPSATIATGPPAGGRWREEAFARIVELGALAAFLRQQTDELDAGTGAILASVDAHLDAARRAAIGTGRSLRTWITGADLERATSNLEAAESDLLRIAPLSYVQRQLPSILVAVQQNLDSSDARRRQVEALARRTGDEPLKEYDREAVVRALRGARSEGRRTLSRLRSFRNVLIVAAVSLAAVAICFAVLCAVDPDAVPLCFASTTEIVCPTDASPLRVSATATGELVPASSAQIDRVSSRTTSPWDVVLVELLGLMAAAVVAAASLRNLRGTSTPYGLPVALGFLKLPTGALTAVLGLLLLRGGFVPGFSAFDSSAQILALAVIFGAAQQLLTRLVDQQALAVLRDVGDVSPRAGPEAAVVTPETIASAVDAVRTSLATPALINYNGVLAVRVLDPDGRPLDGGEGRVAVHPGVAYTVEVTIGHAAPDGARSARVSIEQGQPGDVVPFEVELDSELLALRAPAQEIPVPATGGGRTARFTIEVPDVAGKASIWLRLTQHGRLIQRVSLALEPATSVR